MNCNDMQMWAASDTVRVFLRDVPIDRCLHSRFNTRKSRAQDRIDSLADRLRRNGFERTRALWAVEVDGRYEVFAGGTRLEAAKVAGLTMVPVFVHEGLADDEISRKADEDNENDEYHAPVGLLDVWAECHRLWKEEKWTQLRIAEAKGTSKSLVSERVKWHEILSPAVKDACSNNIFDEGHIREILIEVLTLELFGWLTTEQAQTVLVEEVLSKHVGSSAGIKPTVRVVRDAAKRWKALIQAAEDAYQSLAGDDPRWQQQFVDALARDRVRSEAGVHRALNEVVQARQRHTVDEAARLRAAADEQDVEAQRLDQQRQRLVYLETQTAKLRYGDARELIAAAPDGFQLLLTDPPYGMEFQSQRRVVTPLRDKIANDDLESALKLLADVLADAYAKMADDATCLVFTGWRFEPQFRQVVEAVGFTIKGSLVWAKPNHGAGDLEGAFAPQHERILHAVKGNPKLQHRTSDVLYGKGTRASDHPHEKPRDLLQQLIEATTAPGDMVVDPFFGSGATLVTAFELGRDVFGVELDERWHRLAVDALHKLAEQEWQHALAG